MSGAVGVGARDFDALVSELEGIFAGGFDASLPEDDFRRLSLRAFAHQFAANDTFRAFCTARGATPDTVSDWSEVPTVPATAFKAVDLYAGGVRGPEAVFLTSGTTAGVGARGRHPVARLSLYRASALAGLHAHLVPEDAPLPILSLVPSPREAPESSLSAMVSFAADRWGAQVRWLADAYGSVSARRFKEAVDEVTLPRVPVLVAGTAFAFVHLLDDMAREGVRTRLPQGSRVMETGGLKGRAREVGRDELYGALQERLGVPTWRIVNEYGMTELLSQLYEPVLREGPSSPRGHVAPPWLRVRALHPVTLHPVPEGEPGVLAFFDLANVGSVAHILTQDVGSIADGRLHLVGREAGAEPRGCSLALEEFLAAREARE